MKFRKVRRPRLACAPKPKARVIRRVADVCPWCGAIESLRAYATKRREGKIYRYSKCAKCNKPVIREISLPKRA